MTVPERLAVSEADEPASARSADGMAGLAKGIAILEALGAGKAPMTISDVARRTGISKPAVRRCLLTLTDLGYLRFDGKRYAPTRRVMRLAASYLDAEPLNALAQPYLDGLRDLLNESVALTIWDEGEAVIVARADANRILALHGVLGRRMPGYCTASGRVLMAAMSEAEFAEAMASHPPMAHTDHTVTNPQLIAEAVQDVHLRGYSVVNGEIEVGFLAIAVPLRDWRGDIVAAISVNSSSLRASEEQAIANFLPPLLDVAARISQVL